MLHWASTLAANLASRKVVSTAVRLDETSAFCWACPWAETKVPPSDASWAAWTGVMSDLHSVCPLAAYSVWPKGEQLVASLDENLASHLVCQSAVPKVPPMAESWAVLSDSLSAQRWVCPWVASSAHQWDALTVVYSAVS